MGGDDDPPPGGGVNIDFQSGPDTNNENLTSEGAFKVSEIINNINFTERLTRQRSSSVSDTDALKCKKNLFTTEKNNEKSKKRGRDSPEKNKSRKKQQKLDAYWLSKPAPCAESSNRFSILDCDDGNGSSNDSEGTEMHLTQHQPKPPPIYVSKVECIQPLKDLLLDIAPNKYELRILRADEVKIQPFSIDVFRLITKSLEEKKTEFHTFRPKQERTYNVVLKGVHSSTPVDEIREEIEQLGHEISNISNIKNRVSKQPLPMFFINLKPKPNNKEIYDCTSILHTKVIFEAPRKRREIAQCTRCQRYGHTKSYCHHNPRCVKCSESHLTSQCTRTVRSEKVKCVLCNGNHPANYKGCSIYKQLQEKTYPRLRPRTREENISTQVPQNTLGSYAEALRGSKQSESQNSGDLTELKNMMKTFMEQMSAMMQLLTTVVSKLINESK